MRRLIFLVLFMSFSLCSFAETPVEVGASVDRTAVSVGDRIVLELRVVSGKVYEVVFPEAADMFGDFKLVSSKPVIVSFPRRKETGKIYFLTIFETGQHVIPPVKVQYRTKSGEEWRTAETKQIAVEVKTVLTGSETDINDIKGLLHKPFPRILFAFPALLAAAAAAAYYIRKKRAGAVITEEMRIKTAYEAAYQALKELKAMDLPGRGMIEEYYVRLSDIIRHYLEDRFSYRAPEMTTEEFLNSLAGAPDIEKRHKELLEIFLTNCDMVKFAKYGPTLLEMLDAYKAAENIVDGTRPVEVAGENIT